jgi:hypothetical protein
VEALTTTDDLQRHAKVLLNLLKYELPDLRMLGESHERAQAFEWATMKLERILVDLDDS